ncbi:MAG: T9SS type A sorting domain-containing protein, partial [Flavobacterium sp.]
GNQIQSGIITLTFEDNVQSLLSAAPPTVQTGNTLSWNFTNLMPSQSGEINLTLHLNSPSDTPNVNLGEQLDFTANITSGGADETIADNTSSLQQTVVGSFDPNDKTCLEGSTVSTSVIGDYVHYLIRFENTGTFPAANVVVKDVIDTTKFDLTTLVPLSGSDPFITRITQGNQVEFIFEGINLPFDDANNDGYVAFKIKTKNTLAAGDSFSNNAEIYFDFNLPVVTEPATTLIEMLGTPDFNFSDVFVLYPNPAGNTFAIQTKNGVGIKSVGIYNALGQLLQTFLGNPAAGYDVSNLSPGNYFLKVSTAEGTSTGQLIKD